MAEGSEIFDWEKHTDEILDLYITQNKTLGQVISHMKVKYNFNATERQYKHRFPNLKNVRANEWAWIGQEFQSRAAVGKKSEACLLNRPLPADRVTRETARHKRKLPADISSNPMQNPAPKRIEIRTPVLPVADAFEPISATDSLPPVIPYVPNEMMFPEVNFQGVLDGPIQEDIMPQPQVTEIRPEVELDFFSLNHGNVGNFSFDAAVDGMSVHGGSLLNDARRESVATCVNMARYRSLSPSQILNFDIFDTRPEFKLMTNLPLFKLQTMLQTLDDTNLPINNHFGEVIFSPPSSAVVSSTETRRALLNLLGPIPGGPVTESTALTKKLEREFPITNEGEFSYPISKIFGSHSTGTAGLAEIFGLAIYFVSNNKLSNRKMDTFLQWVVDQRYTEYLERVLQIKTPSIHAFSTYVLKSAVRIKNTMLLRALMNRGVKLDSLLISISDIDDADFIELAISQASAASLKDEQWCILFHRLVEKQLFRLAEKLLKFGVSVDGTVRRQTALFLAVRRKDMDSTRFLLSLGANADKISARAFWTNSDMVPPLAEAALARDTAMIFASRVQC